MVFYGLPIHIIRDLVMTLRSFIKRLTAFLRYRRATQNMNSIYADATAEDIQREDTCIICREEMRPWAATNPQAAPGEAVPRPNGTVNERQRPKKLPCGHILHLGCLKSWLERQQACPTCRAPVVTTTPAGAPAANNGAPPPGILAPGQPNNAAPAAPQQRPQMRMFNLGPLRIGLGQGNIRDVAGAAAGGAQGRQQNNRQPGPRIYGLELGFPGRAPAQPAAQAQAANNAPPPEGRTSATIQAELAHLEAEVSAELHRLQLTQQQIQLVNLMQAEFARLRTLQTLQTDPAVFSMNHVPSTFPVPHLGQQNRPISRAPTPVPSGANVLERHSVRPGTVPIPSGSSELPPGLSIPEGWSLLPLHRENAAPFPTPIHHNHVNVGMPPAVGIQVGHVHQPIPVPPPAHVPSPHIPVVESVNNAASTAASTPSQPLAPETLGRPTMPVSPDAQQSTSASSTAVDTSSRGVEPTSSAAETQQPASSSWKWEDVDDTSDEKSNKSGNVTGKDVATDRAKHIQAREQVEDDNDDDNDDDEEEDEDSDESEEEHEAPKSKGKAVSIEDVDDEDASV